MAASKITASKARYIKLGGKGGWEGLCFKDQTLRLEYFDVPHRMGGESDREGIRQVYLKKGLTAWAASAHAGQVLDFYDSDPGVLWVTFADGCLWWCFARPEVEFIGHDPVAHAATGSRLRRCAGAWRNTSMDGKQLRIAELNGELTQTAGFRGTICDLKPHMVDYLVRRINGEEIPALVEAREARQGALGAMETLIRRLNPNDFEMYVDLLFANSGWRRVAAVGGTQKTVDIELALPFPALRAFVQVKCGTTQRQLDDYVERLSQRDDDFMFFAYHTCKTVLRCDDPRVRLLDAPVLAEMGLRSGMLDWLVQRAA